MIKYIFILLTGFLVSIVTGCDNTNLTHSISMVPRPAQMMPGSGNHLFSDQTVFVVENEEQAEVARSLIALFTRTAGFTPKLNVGGEGNVRLLTDPSLKSEAYSLEVSPQEIIIKASDNKGFFYALQTIRQLLPPSIERESLSDKNLEWSIPVVTIQDEPRFGYRALLLDASRFFIPKENVLRIIDCMSMLKLNTLHFHLTDDNGWRVEIKKYPRLTEVGAWRVDRQDLPFPARRNPKKGEPTPVGGFYTQEDIREMVAYAAERQVEIVPEIDMPAHSNAALAAYPKLACPVVKEYIGVLPGLGGRNSEIIYCAGNDSVFTFLQNVMDEIMELFPSRYIHIGGDEAQKTHWKQCPLCQARMKKEQLANEEVLGMEADTSNQRFAVKFGNQKINLHVGKAQFLPAAKHPAFGSADICLLTEGNIEEIKAEVESKGIEIEVGIVQRQGAQGAIRSIYFRDPDGNLIEVSTLI